MQLMQKTDGQLLAALKRNKNDADAFEQILFRYERLIYHICRRYFNNPEDAMDAGQEAALRVFKGLFGVTLKEDGSLKSWICTVTANACLDIVRKRRVETEELTATVSAQATVASAEENAAARERVREITAAIAKLPDDQKIILILRDLQGLSYEELAASLALSVGTVKSRLSRARAALKKMLPT
jgi:RNA polymerase sigma-70 factor (ECF subfamily)